MSTNQEREWIDADNLREVIGTWDALLADDDHEDMHGMLDDLRALLPAPTPRTLADMTREEREACQWMQADFDHSFADPPIRVVITKTRETTADIILPGGGVSCVHPDSLTPLPDLPRMVWPKDAPEVEEGTYGQALWDMVKKAIRDEKEYHIDAQDYDGAKRWLDVERALGTAMGTNPPKETPDLPRPEDVPAGELWLVEFDGQQYAAERGLQVAEKPWGLMFGWMVSDSEITLVSRLVPEDTHE